MVAEQRTRKPAERLSLSWHWHRRPVVHVTGHMDAGELVINGAHYAASPIGATDPSAAGERCDFHWRLTKADGERYDVDLSGNWPPCSCADSSFNPARPGGCKHRRALTEAMEQGRLVLVVRYAEGQG